MFKKRKKQRRDEEGQSTVEFALTLVLLLSFVMFYIRLAFFMAYGNYVHYATFMAARAFESAGLSPDDQKERARQVIVRMLKKSSGQSGSDRFPTIAKAQGGGNTPGYEVGQGGQFVSGDPAFSWMEGVRYTFRTRMFVFSPGGLGSTGGVDNSTEVILTSESWLGRDPTYLECQREMGRLTGIFDNGC